MNAKLVWHERTDLEHRRAELVRRMDPDERTVRYRAEQGTVTPEERDLLLELEGIDFLLGHGA
ncbi:MULTISPECIES: hypothetical protein [Pseudonocardia]|jgi:hypothetical protein|uniref:Uncharacterized protein n=1 Tax=Pseudonocardia alni TaxID=33907 RepID=A0A852W593_PSEA5|nr:MULTISPECIES: hypothetical protein [Pseudonocardia]MBO4241461.1 hypothetical protein [Pseudonocardia alni]NYG01934.1 hypothetical protein [Pseudonocardia antarctica]